GLPETPAGRPALSLLGHDLAGRGQAIGASAIRADLLRRLAQEDDDGPRRRRVVERRRSRRAASRDRPRAQGEEAEAMRRAAASFALAAATLLVTAMVPMRVDAQAPLAPSKQKFDVASIKPCRVEDAPPGPAR